MEGTSGGIGLKGFWKLESSRHAYPCQVGLRVPSWSFFLSRLPEKQSNAILHINLTLKLVSFCMIQSAFKHGSLLKQGFSVWHRSQIFSFAHSLQGILIRRSQMTGHIDIYLNTSLHFSHITLSVAKAPVITLKFLSILICLSCPL